MSLKNYFVIEQLEKGWPSSKPKARKKKAKKKFWSRLRRRSFKEKMPFSGYEY